MTNRQQDDPGGIKPNNRHQMERTKLTDWKKLAKNKKQSTDGATGEKRQKTSSNGAVRPGPKPWKKVNETAELPMMTSNTTSGTKLDTMPGEIPLGVGGNAFEGRVIDGGRLSGFPGSMDAPPHSPPHHDNRMFKIGLGVFGAIALILGSMLSVFYIQKKRKDEQLKRRKHRQTKSPPQFPPEYPQYPAMHGPPGPIGGMGYDPQMQQYAQQQQMPYPAQFQPQYAYQPQFEQFQNYSPAEQYYNQQAYEQNYYNMCQDYILQQRQMQMEQALPMEYSNQVNPEIIMGENGYKTVMQYVDAIGENLKTPKSKRQKNVVDGASTPHPIITRRAPSMKSLAQSEVSCWTEYEVENEKECDDQKSLDGSDVDSNMDQSEPPKDDAQSQKSDSAYGSRGSIQSPNRYRLKGQMASSQILESEHDSERDDMDSEHGDNVNVELSEIVQNQPDQLGKKTVSINIDENVSVA
jgi:hypothetical protein